MDTTMLAKVVREFSFAVSVLGQVAFALNDRKVIWIRQAFPRANFHADGAIAFDRAPLSKVQNSGELDSAAVTAAVLSARGHMERSVRPEKE
jgi:hypothetical protein